MKTGLAFILAIVLSTSMTHGQNTRPNVLFVQVGFGGGTITERNSSNDVASFSVDYERNLYKKNALQLGLHAGAGAWLKPSGIWYQPYAGFLSDKIKEVAHHIEASGCLRLGRKRHLFGVDAGYAYVKWYAHETRYHHTPTFTLSYLYEAKRGLELRAGASYLRGLTVGVGKPFPL